MGQGNENRQLREEAGFMNNERLYTMIEGLNEKVNELIIDVRQNNHIKDELADLKTKVNENTECINTVVNQKEGKDDLLTKLRDWGGWVVAIITLLIYLVESGVL